ncbi:glycerol-3-phosphate acyltransferase, partial [Intestinimonas massiliensis]|nr:glycerol-3-phosphate acyltransferase [Intestinimonas massiliensis (ex Afouda et al. 2020)]
MARWKTGRGARTLGSGNPGMANIAGALGKGAGALVLAGDLLKTALATSFVLFPDADGERVIISARSMGNTNVQVVLEKLGGG